MTPQRRTQLDGIVQTMIDNNESEGNITFVIDDFKKKYAHEAAAATKPPQKDFLAKATDVATAIFPGTRAIGESLGKAALNIGKLAKGQNPDIPVDIPKAIGGYVGAGSTVASLGTAAPASLGRAALQYGGFGAAAAGGESLARGNSTGQVVQDAALGGAIGAGAGAGFNLLGKGINAAAKKVAPTALSFTSGVPKHAIEQAVANPTAAKQGLQQSVPEIRQQAVKALKSLHTDLSNEFQQGLAKISDAAPIDNTLGLKLASKAQAIAKKFNVSTAPSAKGLVADFDKSAIVRGGESNAVQEALKTVSLWDDFSARGLQDLAQRVGALRNFESGAKTKSSAVVGEIYHAVNTAIKESHIELSSLRSNYANNRRILDEIGNVLGADKHKPVNVQAAVTRLDNLFKDNKDAYVNAIRQLSERSGVDFLSMLSGGEFQRLLPGFIRGAGGGGAVAVGASVVNPLVLLLAPLFSPRAVGLGVRNAPAVGKAASQATRAATVQAIRGTVPK